MKEAERIHIEHHFPNTQLFLVDLEVLMRTFGCSGGPNKLRLVNTTAIQTEYDVIKTVLWKLSVLGICKA